MNCTIPTNYNGINGIKENNTNQMGNSQIKTNQIGMNQMGVNPIFNFYRLLSVFEGLCYRLSHIEMIRFLKTVSEKVWGIRNRKTTTTVGMGLRTHSPMFPKDEQGKNNNSNKGIFEKILGNGFGDPFPQKDPFPQSLEDTGITTCGRSVDTVIPAEAGIQEEVKQKTKSIIQNKPTSKSKLISKSTPKTLKSKPTSKSKLISKSTPKTLKSKPTPKTQTKQSLTQQTNSRPKQSPKSKPRQKPFISITYNNGIVEKSYISKEEQMVLTLAVLRGYGLINMLNRKQSIYNLFNRGLLTLNENGFTKVRNEISDIILSGKPRGSRVFANKMGNVNSLGGDIGRVEWGFN